MPNSGPSKLTCGSGSQEACKSKSRSGLCQPGSLGDYKEQGPPANHAGHIAREKERLYLATQKRRYLLPQQNPSYLADPSLFKERETLVKAPPTTTAQSAHEPDNTEEQKSRQNPSATGSERHPGKQEVWTGHTASGASERIRNENRNASRHRRF